MAKGRSSLALVRTAGGSGTTRLAVEAGATLARDGRDVALVDAAFATQGLADYVRGRIETDITRVLTDDVPVENALYPVDADVEGELVACPCVAPFERLARAKTAGAAGRLEELATDLAARYDHVLLDVPPIASNQAIAAVQAADRIALVAPTTDRGADAVARVRERLLDVGLTDSMDLVLAVRLPGADTDDDDHPLSDDAAVTVPRSTVTAPAEAPVCSTDSEPVVRRAVADAVETALGVELGIEIEDPGLLGDRLTTEYFG